MKIFKFIFNWIKNSSDDSSNSIAEIGNSDKKDASNERVDNNNSTSTPDPVDDIKTIDEDDEIEINKPTLEALGKILKHNSNQVFRVINYLKQNQLNKIKLNYKELKLNYYKGIVNSPLQLVAVEFHQQIDNIELPKTNNLNYLENKKEAIKSIEIAYQKEKRNLNIMLDDFLSSGMIAKEDKNKKIAKEYHIKVPTC